jgi:hypothetical protein
VWFRLSPLFFSTALLGCSVNVGTSSTSSGNSSSSSSNSATATSSGSATSAGSTGSGNTSGGGTTGSGGGYSPLPNAQCSNAFECGAAGVGATCLDSQCCRVPSIPCVSDSDCCQGHCLNAVCGCLLDGEACPALFADAGSYGDGYDVNLGCCSTACAANGMCANIGSTEDAGGGFSPLPGAHCSNAFECGAAGVGATCLDSQCCRVPSIPCVSDSDCCQGHCQNAVCGCLLDGEPCPALFADAGSYGNGYDVNLGCCSAACGPDGSCGNIP